jgi:hypothetical protein
MKVESNSLVRLAKRHVMYRFGMMMQRFPLRAPDDYLITTV